MQSLTKKIILRFKFLEKPRNIIVKIILYVKDPKSIITDFRIKSRLKKARLLGLEHHKPNFLYMDSFTENSKIIDVGCGYEADFSVHLIEKYNLKSFGVDPTQKHISSLKEISKKTENKFSHLQLAVSSRCGTIIFNETQQNESGSIFEDHCNIFNDEIKNYEVESVTIGELIKRIDVDKIEILKLDIEGAEYDLLSKVTKEELNAVNQLYVEFHHRVVKRYTANDTKTIVERINLLGFKSYSLDNINYLFYR